MRQYDQVRVARLGKVYRVVGLNGRAVSMGESSWPTR
jgi:hypothetical protein